MIFYRKGVRKVTKKGAEIMYDIDKKIDFSVFPGMQVAHPPLCSGTAPVFLTPVQALHHCSGAVQAQHTCYSHGCYLKLLSQSVVWW